MDRIKRLTLSLARKTARSDLAQNLLRDIKSLRALWTQIYMGLYVWICIWAVLHHPEAIPTAITVTGGVVSMLFGSYCASRAYEKVRNGNNHVPPGGQGGENGAND